MYASANQGYVETLHVFVLQLLATVFFRFIFKFYIVNNTVLMVCLGLGTTTTWLGLGKLWGLA